MSVEKITLQLLIYLQSQDLDPLLYGSQGLGLYLGNFKKFDDIDILVNQVWLDRKWIELITIMEKFNYKLTDEHEHEFTNTHGTKVSFAGENILIRDHILNDLTQTVSVDVGSIRVRTLRLADFRTAYLFSSKDGYRRETRGKKDMDVIKLIDARITGQ
jgi:hypothetical protein